MFALAIGGLGLLVGPMLAMLSEAVPDRSGGGRDARLCGACGSSRSPSELIPVVGAFRGCPTCDARHPIDLAVTIAAGSLFWVMATVVGRSWVLGPLLVFGAAVLVLAAVDIVRFRLPDRLLFPALALSATTITVLSVATGHAEHVMPAGIGAAAYFGLLLIPNLINPAGLAFGDVKLALLLGLHIGWLRSSIAEGLVLIIYALMLGMLLGVVSGLLVGVGRRVVGPGFLPDPDDDGRSAPPPILRTAFPFGPALAASALIVVLASPALVSGAGLI